MRKPTRLVEDSSGRTKLKVSLPSGRYQLSLNDGAVTLFKDSLGLDVGSKVPEPFVPIVVATRNAWFPHEKDIDRVIDGLPTAGTLSEKEHTVLVTYVTSTWIRPADKERVMKAVASAPIADDVDASQLRIKDLPSLPEGIDFGQHTESPSVPSINRRELEVNSGNELEALPGIGPERAELIRSLGVTTIDQLAETRPADLADARGLSDQMALVAVEGAREAVGFEQSTAERLSDETGVNESTFDAALSQLAASGVPPSEAAPVLSTLFGPSVADVDGVTGQQAYFLWCAGYRTPRALLEASVEELCEVRQVGEKTAPPIKAAAKELVDDFRSPQ